MHAYRASLLWFVSGSTALQPHVHFETDGLLVTTTGAGGVEVVHAIGAWSDLKEHYAHVAVQHWPGKVIAPGFVDMHIHYPQVDVIGSPASGLLPWLENYTFPEEKRFAEPAHAAEVATFFVAELLRNGVTTALTFATSSPSSVQALFAQAKAQHLRLITGLCLMDRHAPDFLLHGTQDSLQQTEALIRQWHGVDRLGYAITPRFAPTSTEAQLRGAGELAAQFPDVWIQSHVAENVDEIAWVRELFPAHRSYLQTYAELGLMRQRAVYAHCIHFDDDDRALMRERQTAAAISPTSNLFLGSGFFDYEGAHRMGYLHGLASDVGGGTSFSPFHTMLAAYYVGRTAVQASAQHPAKPGLSLTPPQLWWQHTAGAAQALGLEGQVGNLLPGCEADFIVLNPQATPLLARRTAQARSVEEWLFALIVLGDDRLVEHTHIAYKDGKPVGSVQSAPVLGAALL
ncbi:guanine deaminase [Curvibacter sp. CHRR-16]|uniref:guanine deaminase n=1 Tax=Curvibacter sp. CHRR-16 TaxID=2835872 RepID=UPI001BDAA7E0|nr:guanine deaminase [Curvibacter sp. CHRR-16]MBT0569001.1 guanine deaminase [Curvibacter sp. CHRR-16]